jgi:hypothetical protein
MSERRGSKGGYDLATIQDAQAPSEVGSRIESVSQVPPRRPWHRHQQGSIRNQPGESPRQHPPGPIASSIFELVDKIPCRAFVPEDGTHQEPPIEQPIGGGIEVGRAEFA